MTLYDTYARPTAANAGFFKRAWSSFASGYIAWRQLQATRAILSQLSDRELADLGYERHQISTMTLPQT